MKHIFFLSLLTFLHFSSILGQCPGSPIYITTQQQIDDFAIDYPGCTEMETNMTIWPTSGEVINNFNGLSQLTSIDGLLSVRNVDATDFSGLENLTSIGRLKVISNSDLTNLSGLNNLSSAMDIAFESNPALVDLSAISNINSLNGLLVWNSPVTTMVDLSNIDALDSLTIHRTELSALTGLESIMEVGRLGVSRNDLLTDLVGLNNLVSVEQLYISSNDNLSSFNGLDEISNIEYIGIDNNNNLTDVTALADMDHTIITSLVIYGNPLLSYCSINSICNFLQLPNAYSSISNNALGCDDEEGILLNCDDVASVNSTVFYDLNNNQVQDNGEPPFEGAALLVDPDEFTAYGSTFYLLSGNYTITYDENYTPDWVLTTSPSSYSLNLAEGDVADVTFGVQPTQQISELQALGVSPFTRCNEIITFDFEVKNTGTTLTSGTLWVSIDPNVTSMNFINPPDQTIAPNLYGWNFTDLYPSQVFTQQVELGIPGPPDFPVGDLLYFDTYADYTDVNGTQTSPVHEYHPTVFCGYDPNDKLVQPDRTNIFPENYTLFGEKLIYTVRFQNTGNDVAYDVEIQDMLDLNLDPGSFQILSSSHMDVLSTKLDTDGLITFTFTDIFLPDSTSNFDASQGYVTYSIDHNPGLAENTIISNFADIYFDANPPITTNTTENVLVSEFPTVSIDQPVIADKISIVPNPNNGYFEVKGVNEGTYMITNTAGQILKQGDFENENMINIQNLPAGIYLINIETKGEFLTKRVVRF